MKRVVLLLVVTLASGCHSPTEPPPKKDPYKDHQACLDAGGQWGPWITHFGCILPSDKRP